MEDVFEIAAIVYWPLCCAAFPMNSVNLFSCNYIYCIPSAPFQLSPLFVNVYFGVGVVKVTGCVTVLLSFMLLIKDCFSCFLSKCHRFYAGFLLKDFCSLPVLVRGEKDMMGNLSTVDMK